MPGFSSGDIERLKEEANIIAKKSSESSSEHLLNIRKKALNLMIIENLREEKKDLSIDFASQEVLDNLNNSEYLDAGDIALEKDLLHLSVRAKIELDEAISLQESARKKILRMDSRIKFA